MEVIEKETIKEVPVDCNGNRVCGGWGYGYGPYANEAVRGNFASKGVAGTGLGLGIAGTALGLLALSRNGGFNLFGGGSNVPQNVNINTDSSNSSGYGVGSWGCGPTAFQVWEKGCEDALALQSAIYKQALDYQNNRFADRQVLNSELFGLYKSQIDADFGLYKSTRDGFDVLSAKQNRDAFGLYKSQRDADDEIRKEIEKRGIKLLTKCDTEIVLYSYIIYGDDCPKRLNGIFAFCIYNLCTVKHIVAVVCKRSWNTSIKDLTIIRSISAFTNVLSRVRNMYILLQW